MKKKEDLNKKVARLEFANDQLLTELAYIDQLMRQVGFSEGLSSLKATAQELYESNQLSDENEEAA